MAASLAGLLILAVLLTASQLILRTTLSGNVLIGSSMKQITRLEGERARTKLSITAATGDTSNNTLPVTVKNDGPLAGGIHMLQVSTSKGTVADKSFDVR